ncbi:MAG: dihydrofolate reductase [Halobaculum sp.]
MSAETRAAVRETDVSFTLIAAVAANGVIGADGEMPWHIPEDLAHFERTTTGHPVILGRRTYDSIVAQLGDPLPDRTSVVLSRQDRSFPDGAVHAESVPAAVRLAAADAADRGVDRVYVAGGATVYAAFLPLADRLVRTELDEAYDGDTRFPAWDRTAWTETDREDHDAFAFVTYERTTDERPTADD